MKKIADAGGLAADAGKTTKAARTLFGIKVPGMFSSVGDKIADVGKHLDNAKDIVKTKGLAKGLTSIAAKTTTSVVGGTLGRAFRIAGSPVFDVVAMGKDVYDIAAPMMDDDIRTQAKKADWGGVLGGVVGGVLGTFIGAPWLGVGLGNMAGEFLGGALDMPEVTANIEKIKLELANEQTAINAEIAGLQADIDKLDLKDPARIALEAARDMQIAKKKILDDEVKNIKALQPQMDIVEGAALNVNAQYKERATLEG